MSRKKTTAATPSPPTFIESCERYLASHEQFLIDPQKIDIESAPATGTNDLRTMSEIGINLLHRCPYTSEDNCQPNNEYVEKVIDRIIDYHSLIATTHYIYAKEAIQKKEIGYAIELLKAVYKLSAFLFEESEALMEREYFKDYFLKKQIKFISHAVDTSLSLIFCYREIKKTGLEKRMISKFKDFLNKLKLKVNDNHLVQYELLIYFFDNILRLLNLQIFNKIESQANQLKKRKAQDSFLEGIHQPRPRNQIKKTGTKRAKKLERLRKEIFNHSSVENDNKSLDGQSRTLNTPESLTSLKDESFPQENSAPPESPALTATPHKRKKRKKKRGRVSSSQKTSVKKPEQPSSSPETTPDTPAQPDYNLLSVEATLETPADETLKQGLATEENDVKPTDTPQALNLSLLECSKEYPLQWDERINQIIGKMISIIQYFEVPAFLFGGAMRDKNPEDFDVILFDTSDIQDDRIPRFIDYIKKSSEAVIDSEYEKRGRYILKIKYYGIEFEFSRIEEHKQEKNVLTAMKKHAEAADFTCNVRYQDLLSGEVIDPTERASNIKPGDELETIIDATESFRKDPVRILRAVRTAAKCDFQMNRLMPVIENLFSGENFFKKINNDRLYLEYKKLFFSGYGLKSYLLLKQHNLFDKLFPSFADLLDNEKVLIDRIVQSLLKKIDETDNPTTKYAYPIIFFAVHWFHLDMNNKKPDIQSLMRVQRGEGADLNDDTRKHCIATISNTIAEITGASEGQQASALQSSPGAPSSPQFFMFNNNSFNLFQQLPPPFSHIQNSPYPQTMYSPMLWQSAPAQPFPQPSPAYPHMPIMNP
jgi:tRNA nucleotidyltransferase/poly(A) polymerase